MIKPAKCLLRALAGSDMEYTFLRSGALPSELTFDGLKKCLRHVATKAESYTKQLDARKQRGKKWDADLCRQHVYLCDLFFEFLNESMQPARDKRFAAAVRVMAIPIFPQTTTFVTAIREQGESLKTAFDRMVTNPEAFKRGCEPVK